MTATQQSQMIIEPVGDFLGGKDAHPRRGQFDGRGMPSTRRTIVSTAPATLSFSLNRDRT